MIVTVTPNPSLDRTVEVGQLRRGEVMRARDGHLDAGGKGVNVTRALTAHGCGSVAVLPVGGDEGAQLVGLLQAQRIRVHAVAIARATRSNITIAEADGTVSKINEPGAKLDATEVCALLNGVAAVIPGASWVVAAGSLPPAVSTGFYAELIRALSHSGVPVAVDTSGPALLEAAKAGPALLKPNLAELADAVGASLQTVGDVVEAAQRLRALGVGAVLASLGPDGAVLVNAKGAWHGEAALHTGRPRSTVGAGDALLAGFLATGGQGREALAVGLTWAAAAVSLPASRMPGPADVRAENVRIHPTLDTRRALRRHG